MKIKYKSFVFLKVIILVVFTSCILSCTNNSSVVSENNYPTRIAGKWLGTVGNLKEAMTLNSDFTFSCQVYPTGFIANTLSEGKRGSINGDWEITGATITLKITGEKNENVENKIATSTIISLDENELELKSDKGEIARFERTKF